MVLTQTILNNWAKGDDPEMLEIMREEEDDGKWSYKLAKRAIEYDHDEIDEEIQKRCKVNQDKANEISKYYRKPSNKKRLSDELIERKITEFLKQFTKVKIETIKTADLRKKELEHTHEH